MEEKWPAIKNILDTDNSVFAVATDPLTYAQLLEFNHKKDRIKMCPFLEGVGLIYFIPTEVYNQLETAMAKWYVLHWHRDKQIGAEIQAIA